jgi:hypothetical protein
VLKVVESRLLGYRSRSTDVAYVFCMIYYCFIDCILVFNSVIPYTLYFNCVVTVPPAYSLLTPIKQLVCKTVKFIGSIVSQYEEEDSGGRPSDPGGVSKLLAARCLFF